MGKRGPQPGAGRAPKVIPSNKIVLTPDQRDKLGTRSKVKLMTVHEIASKFQVYADEALLCLVDIMRDVNAGAGNRIAASKEVLSRGFGSSVQTINLNEQTPDGGKKVTFVQTLDTEKLSALVSIMMPNFQRAEEEDAASMTNEPKTIDLEEGDDGNYEVKQTD